MCLEQQHGLRQYLPGVAACEAYPMQNACVKMHMLHGYACHEHLHTKCNNPSSYQADSKSVLFGTLLKQRAQLRMLTIPKSSLCSTQVDVCFSCASMRLMKRCILTRAPDLLLGQPVLASCKCCMAAVKSPLNSSSKCQPNTK